MSARLGRRRTSIDFLVALTTAVLFASSLFYVINPAKAIDTDGGYVISNVVLEDQTSNFVRVRYDYRWATKGFPGWHECTWTALGEDGAVVGQKAVRWYAMQPTATGLSAQIPLMPGAARAVSAEASCNTTRLDEPDGRYVISDVRVEPAPEFPDDRRTYELSFDDRWVGSGPPGVAECTLTAISSEGDAIFLYDFTFEDGSGSSNDFRTRVIVPTEVNLVPASGTVVCSPYS